MLDKMEEKNKTIAIKRISKELKEEIETIINKIIIIKEFTFEDLESFLTDLDMFDDCEEAYFSYGVAITFNDEICMVDVDKLIEGLENDLENDSEDTYAKEKKQWIKKLKKYGGCNIEQRRINTLN